MDNCDISLKNALLLNLKIQKREISRWNAMIGIMLGITPKIKIIHEKSAVLSFARSMYVYENPNRILLSQSKKRTYNRNYYKNMA